MKKGDSMGARFWLGMLLLLGVLAVSVLGGVLMEQAHGTLSADLERAAVMALSGDLDGAVSLAQQTRNHWQKNWKWTASGADQTPMDTIDSLFSQLRSYEQAGKAEEFAACCYQLSALVQTVADAHKGFWWNIF